MNAETIAGNRLVVGISGASGVIYGVRLLELLKGLGIETHPVLSKAAEMTLAYEMDRKPQDIRALAHPVFRHRILTNFHAESEKVGKSRIVDDLLAAVPLPRSGM